MGERTVRFGVGDPAGARSSEWFVTWKPDKSDVYIGARVLGGSFKVSLHETGQCHVRGPDPRAFRVGSPPPKFVDLWAIDTGAAFVHPFGLIFPASELRAERDWKQFRDRGTKWMPLVEPQCIEVGVFLTRSMEVNPARLKERGWHTVLVQTRLPDGRDLSVLAGETHAIAERMDELVVAKTRAREMMTALPVSPRNPRIVVFAVNETGVRRFIECATD